MVVMALLAALAYVVMVFIRIPVISFLKYEPKDVIITIGGFIYGPLASLFISLIVTLVEMGTVSDTGWIGAVMNFVSTAAFVLPATIIYKKMHNLKGAVIGLVSGVVSMIIVMLLWNYILTPLYMGYPREAVAKMLPTVFLPFNALKGGLNAALTMLLYKPVITALRAANLVPRPEEQRKGSVGTTILVVVLSLALAATLVLVILALQGVI
ncbi:MAG: ECF transporter S component [Lachnospiraceae bacterium]|nr:ECF transporter S component [Lachnospiraceae bacterium]